MPCCRSLAHRLACAVFGVALLATSLMSQTFYGSIVGAVADASGGTIRGAKVTVTNTSTSEQRNAETSEDGAFRFVNLIQAITRSTSSNPDSNVIRGTASRWQLNRPYASTWR